MIFISDHCIFSGTLKVDIKFNAEVLGVDVKLEIAKKLMASIKYFYFHFKINLTLYYIEKFSFLIKFEKLKK